MNTYFISIQNEVSETDTPLVYVNANSLFEAVNKWKNSMNIIDFPKFTIEELCGVTMIGESSLDPIGIYYSRSEESDKDFIYINKDMNSVVDLLANRLISSIETYTELARFIM